VCKSWSDIVSNHPLSASRHVVVPNRLRLLLLDDTRDGRNETDENHAQRSRLLQFGRFALSKHTRSLSIRLERSSDITLLALELPRSCPNLECLDLCRNSDFSQYTHHLLKSLEDTSQVVNLMRELSSGAPAWSPDWCGFIANLACLRSVRLPRSNSGSLASYLGTSNGTVQGFVTAVSHIAQLDMDLGVVRSSALRAMVPIADKFASLQLRLWCALEATTQASREEEIARELRTCYEPFFYEIVTGQTDMLRVCMWTTETWSGFAHVKLMNCVMQSLLTMLRAYSSKTLAATRTSSLRKLWLCSAFPWSSETLDCLQQTLTETSSSWTIVIEHSEQTLRLTGELIDAARRHVATSRLETDDRCEVLREIICTPFAPFKQVVAVRPLA
jgi:hypothetical protein